MNMSQTSPGHKPAAEIDQNLHSQEMDRHNGPMLPLDPLHTLQHKPCEPGYQAIPTRNELETFGTESPDAVSKNAATSLSELKPIERFLKEACGVQDQLPHRQTYFKLSKVGAAVRNSVKKSGDLGGEYPDAHRHDDEPTFSHSEAISQQSAMLSMVGTWCDNYADGLVDTNGSNIKPL